MAYIFVGRKLYERRFRKKSAINQTGKGNCPKTHQKLERTMRQLEEAEKQIVRFNEILNKEKGRRGATGTPKPYGVVCQSSLNFLIILQVDYYNGSILVLKRGGKIMRAITTAMAFGILLFLLLTRELYINIFEWIFILISCLAISFVAGDILIKRGLRVSYKDFAAIGFAIYIALTLFDIVGDYVIVTYIINPAEVDGALPSFGEVFSETYDDFMLLNFIAPALMGCLAAFLSKLKSKMV